MLALTVEHFIRSIKVAGKNGATLNTWCIIIIININIMAMQATQKQTYRIENLLLSVTTTAGRLPADNTAGNTLSLGQTQTDGQDEDSVRVRTKK